MSLNTQTNSLAARLAAANPNTIADLLRFINFGQVVRQQRSALYRQNPNVFAAGAASPYDLATLQVIVLPDDAKASKINRAYARVGTGATGEMTLAAAFATPTTGQIGVTPAGNIAFLGTDAYTDVDFDYEVAKQDVLEVTLPVVPGTGVLTLPAAALGVAGSGSNALTAAPSPLMVSPGAFGVVTLLEAEALAGTTTGKKIVLAPGTGRATGQAQLNVAKTQVLFAVADAVTSARVKLGVAMGTTGAAFGTKDLNTLLELVSTGAF